MVVRKPVLAWENPAENDPGGQVSFGGTWMLLRQKAPLMYGASVYSVTTPE